MPRFVASRLAVPAGMIADGRLRAREHVDAVLHHAVAAPHDHQLGAALERACRTSFGAFLDFGTSCQSGSVIP